MKRRKASLPFLFSPLLVLLAAHDPGFSALPLAFVSTTPVLLATAVTSCLPSVQAASIGAGKGLLSWGLAQGAAASLKNLAMECVCNNLPVVKGKIADCCCTEESLEQINAALEPHLDRVVTLDYFRFFKANLWKECPFWPEDGQCAMRACSLSECTEDDLPRLLREDSLEGRIVVKDLPKEWSSEEDHPRHWTAMEDDDAKTAQGDLKYYELGSNPERFTGYAGESAHRIWSSIYEENCFTREDSDTCTEKRIFYRLVSGLHASISTHLSWKYLHPDGSWGPNLEEYERRVGSHLDRIENLMTLYSLLVRAVAKAGPQLVSYPIRTGNDTNDALAVSELRSIISLTGVSSTCPETFDERAMFKGENASSLMEQARSRFFNISRILDCVGCEKCRLWGKIQILGLGTALKVLFAPEDQPSVPLTRSEVVALVNFFAKVSYSVKILGEYRLGKLREGLLNKILTPALILSVILIALVLLKRSRGKRDSEKSKKE